MTSTGRHTVNCADRGVELLGGTWKLSVSWMPILFFECGVRGLRPRILTSKVGLSISGSLACDFILVESRGRFAVASGVIAQYSVLHFIYNVAIHDFFKRNGILLLYMI